jgi:hypothetical protein
MSLCTAVGCGCKFAQQVLLDAMKERTKEEGDQTIYPPKLKYIVHGTDDWYCSAKDCGHAISLHSPAPALEDMTEAVRMVLLATKTHDTPQNVRTFVNRQRCVACGYHTASCAHIIIASEHAVQLGLDVNDFSNFLPLCGNKGDSGTCHDAFDNAALVFYYSPAEKCWRSVVSTKYRFNRPVFEKPQFRIEPHKRAMHLRTRLFLNLYSEEAQHGNAETMDRIRGFIDCVAKHVGKDHDTPPSTRACEQCKGNETPLREDPSSRAVYCELCWIEWEINNKQK